MEQRLNGLGWLYCIYRPGSDLPNFNLIFFFLFVFFLLTQAYIVQRSAGQNTHGHLGAVREGGGRQPGEEETVMFGSL